MARMSGFVGGILVDKPVRLMDSGDEYHPTTGGSGGFKSGSGPAGGDERKSKRFRLVKGCEVRVPAKLASLLN